MFSSLGWLYGKCRTRLEIDKLEGLAKIYRFNLSNAAEQLHHTQLEMSSEMIKSIAETIFNELEELKEFENEELLNPAEDLMPNEPDLNINISDTIDLTSPIFQNANNR